MLTSGDALQSFFVVGLAFCMSRGLLATQYLVREYFQGYADSSLGAGAGVQETYPTSDSKRYRAMSIDDICTRGGVYPGTIPSSTLHQGTCAT